jgi:glycosyltransferase involved in cell wall biosynthesis
MISPQFRPIAGGYERAAERLSGGLAAAGHKVEVVTERRRLSWPRHEISKGIIIRRIPVLSYRGIHSFSSALSLFFFLLIHGRRFDLFHVHQYGWSAAVASAMGLLFHKPVFLKLTNTGLFGLDAVLPRGMVGSGVRWLHLNIACCIVTSTRAADEAEAFGFSEEKICMIPNPLETEVFRPASDEKKSSLRKELGLEGKFVAICAARLSIEKNHAMLIKAWNLFVDKVDDAELILLGQGPLDEDIRRLSASSKRPDTIRVPGQTDRPLPWYQAADVYTLSSNAEGLSNSLMEALSAGLSVVSTHVSGSEDIFEAVDIGEMIPVDDHEAMAEALLTLEKDPRRRDDCGRRARKYAIEHYSLDAIAKQMEICYQHHGGRGTYETQISHGTKPQR